MAFVFTVARSVPFVDPAQATQVLFFITTFLPF